MSWITPKTDWVDSDYFNYEDALRINNNLQHLIDLASEIYDYRVAFYLLFYYQSVRVQTETQSYNQRIYTVLRIDQRSIEIPVIERGSSDLANVLFKWHYAIAKLEILALQYFYGDGIEPVYLEEYTSWKVVSGKNVPDHMFNGWGWKGLGSGQTDVVRMDYFLYYYGAMDLNNYSASRTIPYYDHDYVMASFNYRNFSNTPFYNAYKINSIESAINRIYTLFHSRDQEG